MDGACEKRESFKENMNCKEAVTNKQERTAETSGTYNDEIKFGEFNTHSTV